MPDISAQRFTAAIVKAGADGMAVVSAICAAPDPERAARELARAVRAAR
jgi:thiamine-phosphate pyrophosphorylase